METDSQRQKKRLVAAKGEKVGRATKLETAVSRCQLLYIEWTNKSRPYSTVNCIQYPWINHIEKEYEKEYMYLYNCVILLYYSNSVQFSHSVVSNSLRPYELQHSRPPCPSTPGVHSNSCPSCRWCHPAISSSVVPFSFCPQSLPASGSFPMSQFFAWGGQSTGASALASFNGPQRMHSLFHKVRW